MNKHLSNLLSLVSIVFMWFFFAVLVSYFPFVILAFITIGFILLAIAFIIFTALLIAGLFD